MKINLTNKVVGWGIVFASLAVFIRRTWLMELDSFEFDDAFMFIRYAENILAGQGYTWNAGDPLLFGNTSILYTYVIAISKGLFGNWLTNSQVLVFVAFIFALLFLFILQRGLFKLVQSEFLKNKMVLALCTIPFIIFPLIYGFQVSTGMETTMSLLFNGLFVFAVVKVSRKEVTGLQHYLIPVFIGYLLFLIRPDNALVVALFPVLLFLSKRNFSAILKYVILLTAFIAVDSLIKYVAFGDVLPLSFYAKKSGFTEGYTARYFWNPIKYITQIVAYMMPFILTLFVFTRRKNVLWLSAYILPLVVTFIYYFSFDQIMGFNARLYFPFIPYIIIPAIILLDDRLLEFKGRNFELFNLNSMISKLSLLLVFLFVMVFSKYRFINQYENYLIQQGKKEAIAMPEFDNRRYNREVSIKKITEILKQFPDDFVFAATEHGYISGDNPTKRILDFSGLHNQQIAKEGYSEEILKKENPDFIWLPHQDLTVLHYRIRTGTYFMENYELIPSVYAFGCAIRKDSKYYEELKGDIK